ncbi:MAG: four helix bundle protein [Planctomycetota bacterium]
MNSPDRPRPRPAPAELLVLTRAEDAVAWLLSTTARWPKRLRATLTQRIEHNALELLEQLTLARYHREGRHHRLDQANLLLERERRLLRLAVALHACPHAAFESAMRRFDEVGRLLHGWRRRGAAAPHAETAPDA